MKKIKFFTTHALAIIVSVFATSAYFLLFELPDVIFYEHNEPKYIKLPTEEDKVHYHEISEQFYKGNLYLKHPLYFFKRQEGHDLLADLANRGYTPAAHYLFSYYHTQSILNDSTTDKEEARRWAVVSANNGAYGSLLMYLELEKPFDQDISEQIALLEKLAPQSELNITAYFLHEYYKEINQPEKAEKWFDVAQEIDAKPFVEPACTTITPWQGY